MKDVLVIDDFIPKYNQRVIERYFLSSQPNWKFVSNTNNPDTTHGDLFLQGNRLKINNDQSGMVISHKHYGYESMDLSYGIVSPLVERSFDFFNIDQELIRSKTNMYLKHDEEGIHSPHVDFFFPHTVVIYYVNDSDGDTVIFNEIADSESVPTNLSINRTISPKVGRAVIFNGLMYHCVTPPKNSKSRIVVNMDFVAID